MHFSASTILAVYLHQFSAVVQNYPHFWCHLGQICIKFSAYLASKLKQIMQKQHVLKVIFGTNLVSNISTIGTQKEPFLMPD